LVETMNGKRIDTHGRIREKERERERN
jgi:hypothetical protein